MSKFRNWILKKVGLLRRKNEINWGSLAIDYKQIAINNIKLVKPDYHFRVNNLTIRRFKFFLINKIPIGSTYKKHLTESLLIKWRMLTMIVGVC